MEPREQRRDRSHRTKRARRAENRDLIPILKSPNSATRYWKLVPRLVGLLWNLEMSTSGR